MLILATHDNGILSIETLDGQISLSMRPGDVQSIPDIYYETLIIRNAVSQGLLKIIKFENNKKSIADIESDLQKLRDIVELIGSGTTGTQGATGLIGLMGEQGDTGLGMHGIEGNTGIQGTTGIKGLTGIIGTTGIKGLTGIIGITGIKGTTGIMGIQGLTGSQIFGQNYTYQPSLEISTTISTNFQNKVSVISPNIIGIIYIQWSAVVSQSAINKSIRVRFQNITSSTQIGSTIFNEPKDDSDRISIGGFSTEILSGTAQTYAIQYSTVSGGIAGIEDAKIIFWRIS